MIQSAALELWGVATDLEFTFNVSFLQSLHTCFAKNASSGRQAEVERSRACIKMALDGYGDSCVFKDILDLISNPPEPPSDWVPSKLKLVKEAWCVQHKKMCLP